MQNLDKTLKCHPEHIDIIIKAFQLYANKNDIEFKEVLSDVTTIELESLQKRYKKYKKKTTPYAKITPPASSYSYFMKENYNKIKDKLNTEKPALSEVSKAVSQVWSNLDNKIKKKYEILSKQDKKRYNDEKDNVDSKLKVNNVNKPKRPQSAFFFFLADVRPKIKKNNPGIKTTDIAKEGRTLWQNLNTNTKNKYKNISDLDKQRYANEKEHYLNELAKQ